MALTKKIRHPCLLSVVRYQFPMYAQEGAILNGASCQVHPLEVSRNMGSRPVPLLIMIASFPFSLLSRQTVFYTVDTIKISQGGTVNGTISCAPNQRNNRDLDISISYQTDEGQSASLEYKMCVIFLLHTLSYRCLCQRILLTGLSGLNVIHFPLPQNVIMLLQFRLVLISHHLQLFTLPPSPIG